MAKSPIMFENHAPPFQKKSDMNERACSLLDHIVQHFRDPKTSDVVVKIIDPSTAQVQDEYYSHKLILTQCQYFSAMMTRHNFKESRSSVIELYLDAESYDRNCTNLFFKMLYFEGIGDLKDLGPLALNLYAMCRMLRFQRGEEHCERILLENLDNNICELTEFAYNHHAQNLKLHCSNWIRTFAPISPLYQEKLKGMNKELLQKILSDGPCNTGLNEVRQMATWMDLALVSQMIPERGIAVRLSFDLDKVSFCGNIYKLKEDVFWEDSYWSFSLIRDTYNTFQLSVNLSHQPVQHNHLANSILAHSRSYKRPDFTALRLKLSVFLKGETQTNETGFPLDQTYYRHDTNIRVHLDWRERAYRSGIDFDPDTLRYGLESTDIPCYDTPIVFAVITMSRG